jgi:very-short-patch-repair endonuclease
MPRPRDGKKTRYKMSAGMKRRARGLGKRMTAAEIRLWACLRNRGIAGLRFRRQQVIGPYVVDFFCPAKKLVIELDGGQHAGTTKEDGARDEFLAKAGMVVLRFWNNEFMENEASVLGQIARAAEGRRNPMPGKPSPLVGEGQDEGGPASKGYL